MREVQRGEMRERQRDFSAAYRSPRQSDNIHAHPSTSASKQEERKLPAWLCARKTRLWLPVALIIAIAAATFRPDTSPSGSEGFATLSQKFISDFQRKLFVQSGEFRETGTCSDRELLKWAKKHGVYADKLEVADFAFENPGVNASVWTDRVRWRRGMMATDKIIKGQPIVVVPLHLVLSPGRVSASELGPVLQAFPNLTR